MSANLIISIGQTTKHKVTIAAPVGVGGTPMSGIIFGEPVNMQHTDTLCNVFATATGSGPFVVLVQDSPDGLSGTFTDPTSGLARMPAGLLSGGRMVCNSGLWPASGVPLASPISGQPLFCSGGAQGATFQRKNTWVRGVVESGTTSVAPTVTIISQLLKTASGGGSTQSPGSGVPSV